MNVMVYFNAQMVLMSLAPVIKTSSLVIASLKNHVKNAVVASTKRKQKQMGLLTVLQKKEYRLASTAKSNYTN